MRPIDALIARYEAVGVGSAGTTIFAGSDTDLPSSGTPAFLTLLEAGGREPIRAHNTTPIRQPGIQVTARGDSYLEVAALIDAAYAASGGVDPLVNVTLAGIFFLDIHPTNEPLTLPNDAQNRVRLSFNVAMKRR